MREPKRDRFDRFEEAFGQGRRRAAYEAALEVWTCTRAPEVASWIERLAGAFCEQTPLDLGSPKKFQEGWVAAARSREPYDLRFLVGELVRYAHARDSAKDMAFIVACVQELGPKTEDPSVVAPTLQLCRFPWIYQSGSRLRARWLKWIADVRDPRCLETLRRFAGTENDALTQRMVSQIVGHAHTALTVEESDRLSTVVSLLDKGLPARASESLASPGESVAELYARVLAAPEDLEVRAVWADALLRSGDPRGEIVSLGLAARTNPKAQAALTKRISKEWRQWLGPAAPSVVKSTLQFEDGLLAACAVHAKTQSAADMLFGHAIWQTVKRLSFVNYGRFTSNMLWLEEVYGAMDTTLTNLATLSLPRLRVLEIDFGGRDFKKRSRGVTALAATRGLPRLRCLLLRTNDGWRLAPTPPLQLLQEVLVHFDWIFEAPWSGQLEELALPTDVLRLTAEALEAYVHSLRRLPKLRSVGLGAVHRPGTYSKSYMGPVIDLERREMSYTGHPIDGVYDTLLAAGVSRWRELAAALGMPFRDEPRPSRSVTPTS